MNHPVTLACALLLAAGSVFHSAPAPAAQAPSAVPQKVTLDGILNPGTDDSLAFAPGDKAVYFDRSNGHRKTIMVSHEVNGRWSQPRPADFSGRWDDEDPAVAPDGSYIVFSSNRPISKGGNPLVRVVGGKPHSGGNLWKVQRTRDGWGKPQRLGPPINDDNFIVAPSIAADGDLYFIKPDNGAMHIFRSSVSAGRYQSPVRVSLGDPTVPTHDPAIAPDESFIVFEYGEVMQEKERLCIAFRNDHRWGKPIDLGDAVNKDLAWSSHMAANGRAITFSGKTGFWRLSLMPWLQHDVIGQLRRRN